jgi:hypothetical protein
MSDCLLAHSDAAYVLGALSPADRLEYERHLPGCAPCRRSVAQLAGMPGLLGRVPREQVEAPLPVEPLPETVLPALVAAVRREQRRRALTVTLGAAAAIAAVAIGIGALQAGRDDGGDPQAQPPATSPTSEATPAFAPKQAMAELHDYGVHAEVGLTEKGWGTAIRLDCRYDERESDYGSDHDYDFTLVLFTEYGGKETLMSWQAGPGDSYFDLPGTTKTDLGEITKVEVQGESGKPILRLDL